jgi:23S rRNA (uracil1939-C5)-methyltransferase
MRRKRRQRLPKDPIVLEIEKLSHEGRGIAHLDGKVVFVEDALPGEQVSAIYTQRRDAFDQARTQTVLRSSPHRIEPPCEYATICGGCSLQHFEAQAQLSFKAEVLHELLQHALDSAQYEHLAPLEGPHFAYRRKARLAVRYVHKKEQVLIGFREKNSSFITNMSHCEILDERISRLLPALQELIRGLQAYQHIPQIEVALGDEYENTVSLALVFRHLTPLTKADESLLSAFAQEHQLELYLQGGGPETVSLHYPPQGEERLYYELPEYDLKLAFHPLDFTQINAGINHKMVHKGLELLALNKEDSVLDLFCGLGNFTLPAATLAGHVLGIEGSEEMVQRGRENASRMGLENVDFMSADLASQQEKRPWAKRNFSKILLDPPRSGAIEIIAELAALRPQRIVYVSCNPATLARDAACLQEHGYRLAAAGVMDMFPQTTHVESIALFLPKGRSAQ